MIHTASAFQGDHPSGDVLQYSQDDSVINESQLSQGNSNRMLVVWVCRPQHLDLLK